MTRPDAHEDAGGAGAHQVQRSLVRRASTDDHRDVELAHEALEVQRLDGLRDVLGRHDCALDDEQIELGLEDRFGQLRGALRRDARAGHHPRLADLTDARRHQLGLDRRAVDVLHPQRRLLGGELGDLGEQRLGVVVPGPEALEVEHADAAQPTDLDRRRRRDDAIHRRAHERQIEAKRVDLPRDVDILGVARAPARDDRDVVEPVPRADRTSPGRSPPQPRCLLVPIGGRGERTARPRRVEEPAGRATSCG